jgi:hypothetical protein
MFIEASQSLNYCQINPCWQPTFSMLCRQGREETHLCPRCNTTVETNAHIRECSDNDATRFQQEQPQTFILALEHLHTAPFILTTFEYKLSIAYCLPYEPKNPFRENIPIDLKDMLTATRSTTSLQQWLARIAHLKKVSESLYAHGNATQLTLHQVLARLPNQNVECNKFPP